jgi:hypothetical protein
MRATALMVVITFLGFVQVLLRLFLEIPLTAGGAEVIGFPFILHTSRGLGRINFHATNRVFCHFLNLLFN